MSKTVNLYDAKTHVSNLVERAAAGEEIIIAKAGKPRARLMPLPEPVKEPRRPGGWKGRIWISDDFDDPLPPEVLRGFLGLDVDRPGTNRGAHAGHARPRVRAVQAASAVDVSDLYDVATRPLPR